MNKKFVDHDKGKPKSNFIDLRVLKVRVGISNSPTKNDIEITCKKTISDIFETIINYQIFLINEFLIIIEREPDHEGYPIDQNS